MTSSTRIFLMLGPLIAVIGLLFGGGLGVGLMQSLGMMADDAATGPTLAAYRAVLSQPEFLQSFGFSLYLSVMATALSAILAVAVALLLRQSFRGRGTLAFVAQITLTVPHVVGAIGILYLFAQSGLIARLAAEAGLITRPAEFPALVYDRQGIGIILHYVWKEVPFITLVLLAQMQGIAQEYEAVARSHGANRWQAFWHVLLPLIAPGLMAASVIVFAFVFGTYEVPLLLGANAPAALPVLAYRAYVDVDLGGRAQAMAMAMVIAALSAGLILMALRAARRALAR